MAIRMARAYTGKTKIIKFEDHFHGWSDYVAAGGEGIGGIPQEALSTMIVLPPNDISVVEKALQENEVAGIILEPTGAHWGTHPLPPSYLHAARQATAETGTLLILDEVITGFRLAPGGAQQRFGVTPDLSTHAKIVAGGLPGGCVTGRDDIVSMLEIRDDDSEWNGRIRVQHQGTFNANPVSAAAGTTALRLIAGGEETARADAACERLVRGLNALFEELSVPGSAWGLSSMWHLNLGEPPDGAEVPRPADVEWDAPGEPPGVRPELERPLKWALFTHGVDLMGTGGMLSSAHGDELATRTN